MFTHFSLSPRQALLAGALLFANLPGISQADQPACPTGDFKTFFDRFAASPDLQRTFTATPLTLQTMVDGQPPRIHLSKLSAKQRPTDLLPSAEIRQKAGLTMEWLPPSSVLLRGQKGEYMRAYIFKRQSCWVLFRIEDWTLGGSQLVNEDATADAKQCLKRAKAYEFIATSGQSASVVELFKPALDSYLCAAEGGSAEAAYSAASLSLSGQAPRLSNERIQNLLEMAAKKRPEAALALSDFYCTEGDYENERPCVHPQLAARALIAAARMDSADALNRLGYAYEAGTLVQRDPIRALACYTTAAAKGSARADKNVKRLAATGVPSDNSIECVQAGR